MTELISGDTVFVARTSGGLIERDAFTSHATNNVEGDTTIEVQESITSSYPTSGKIRMHFTANGVEHRYRYASWSGSIFTLAPASTGSADAGSDATTLYDAAADFVTDGVEPGDIVRNTSTGGYGRVVSVDDLNTLTTEDLDGGWPLDWSTGNNYSVNTLIQDYNGNDTAYVPFIERVADTDTESNTLIYSAPITVRVVVRNAGVIQPFSQDQSIGSGGLSVPAIRNPDEIYA